jgi:hypothetical protein
MFQHTCGASEGSRRVNDACEEGQKGAKGSCFLTRQRGADFIGVTTAIVVVVVVVFAIVVIVVTAVVIINVNSRLEDIC